MDQLQRQRSTVIRLNLFLRLEYTAAEAYRQVIARFPGEPTAALHAILSSHLARCEVLRRRVVRLGGFPHGASGLWGGYSDLRDAMASGPEAAIAVLAAWERWATEDYSSNLKELDHEAAEFITEVILPEHERCLHRIDETVGQA